MSRSLRRVGSHCAPRRRVWHLPPDGFRELRRSCLLSRKACADLLGCSMSAIRAWDRGTHRVPWSAVKLLRLYRRGDLGALRPEWRGWTLNRGGLVSPEGVAYGRGDLGWWSLTVFDLFSMCAVVTCRSSRLVILGVVTAHQGRCLFRWTQCRSALSKRSFGKVFNTLSADSHARRAWPTP